MQFTLLMAQSAQNASHTQGIHKNQMWEHAEIWKKKVKEEKRREGRWAAVETALKFQPSPQKKKIPVCHWVWGLQLVKYWFWMMWGTCLSGEPQSALSSGDLHNYCIFRHRNMMLSPGACRYREQGRENPACVDCGSLKTAHLTPADPLYCRGLREGNMLFSFFF